jgi:hypothetical protein
METGQGRLFTGVWIPEEVARLMVHLRQHGVPVFEASAAGEGALCVRFEPNLGQTGMLDSLLTAWPGVGRVEHVRAGLVLAHGLVPKDERRPGRRRFAAVRSRRGAR